jgi:TM2 domain-containing membrane protein YozV
MFAGLFLTYVRFQKNYLKANWGLLVVALYIFIILAMQTFNLIRFGYFYWEFIPFSLIPSIAIFYAIYLILPEMMPSIFSQMKNSEKKQKYQPSDELSEKEFLPTLILCFFVGFLGIHRFYAGKIGTGILLIVTLGGLGIWVLVDFIMICIGSFRDIEGRIIKYQRAVVIMSERGAAEELEKFAELKEKGIISEEEFNKKKEELL